MPAGSMEGRPTSDLCIHAELRTDEQKGTAFLLERNMQKSTSMSASQVAR